MSINKKSLVLEGARSEIDLVRKGEALEIGSGNQIRTVNSTPFAPFRRWGMAKVWTRGRAVGVFSIHEPFARHAGAGSLSTTTSRSDNNTKTENDFGEAELFSWPSMFSARWVGVQKNAKKTGHCGN